MAYLADIFQQLNKVYLKLQGKGRTIVNFIRTLSTFVEKLDNWKQKAQAAEKFSMLENLATAAGDKVNVDIASEVVQHLGGLREEFVLYFPKIIKTNLDLVKNIWLFQWRMLLYACKMNSLTFRMILGSNTCSILIQFVIFG